MKTIKLMPDYHCYPLWDMTPYKYCDLDPQKLPISRPLQIQLMDWAKVYDETLNIEYPVDSGFSSVDTKNAFEAEGARLANRLRDELGPELTVEVSINVFVKDSKDK